MTQQRRLNNFILVAFCCDERSHGSKSMMLAQHHSDYRSAEFLLARDPG